MTRRTGCQELLVFTLSNRFRPLLGKDSPMSFSLQELANHLDAETSVAADLILDDVASLHDAKSSHLSYVESRKQLKQLKGAQAGALLTNAELADQVEKSDWNGGLLVVDDPQKRFIEAMLLFRPRPEREAPGVSPAAHVAESAEIADDCCVHAGAMIGENVTIGRGTEIYPGVVIGPGTSIGANCILYPNVVIYRECEVRDRVIIHGNAVIGADGFGYRFEQGAFVKIPHTGRTILEDDVEIGACATVDRGMIGNTIVAQGTKIDNLVHVAHNCQVGRHNAFAGQVGLAGSVTTGDYVQMGGQVGIADHITVGTGAKLGGKSGVMSNIPDGQTYYGAPALPEKMAIRTQLAVHKLPELREQVKQLAAEVAALTQATQPDTSRSAA